VRRRWRSAGPDGNRQRRGLHAVGNGELRNAADRIACISTASMPSSASRDTTALAFRLAPSARMRREFGEEHGEVERRRTVDLAGLKPNAGEGAGAPRALGGA